jgi:hypothetical protein
MTLAMSAATKLIAMGMVALLAHKKNMAGERCEGKRLLRRAIRGRQVHRLITLIVQFRPVSLIPVTRIGFPVSYQL